MLESVRVIFRTIPKPLNTSFLPLNGCIYAESFNILWNKTTRKF